ncbi:E3 ubiquitin-protein ligase DCST1 [Microcaecilia unicolor]|uniref:E3 ubiquitin-protein ligase DCST1 n=1 Tax=Microcaecilia unicolor TaxID=1415580 RepID=A0A6P7WNU9_9AMPH|nr:E3 ubiquitin-protein ligase DCST1 [Microcaecilia unicolor]XP_030044812.1 E3 ubiquitin-protein ligase DCST1-like [Microcaecilia unicolor]
MLILEDPGKLSQENPDLLVLEVLGDLSQENCDVLALEVLGELAKDNPDVLALEVLGELAKDNPDVLALEVLGELAKDNPDVMDLEVLGELAKDNPDVLALEVLGELAKDNPDVMAVEVLGELAKKNPGVLVLEMLDELTKANIDVLMWEELGELIHEKLGELVLEALTELVLETLGELVLKAPSELAQEKPCESDEEIVSQENHCNDGLSNISEKWGGKKGQINWKLEPGVLHGFKSEQTSSGLKRALTFLLPSFCVHYLWSGATEFRLSKFFLGAGFGGLIAVGLFYVLIDPMSLYENHKIRLLYGLFGIFSVGCGLSLHFRCASLLLIPQVLSKEGRAYLLMYVLASIYAGPITNLQRNLDSVVKSVGCTVELQINHTKEMWRVAMAPFRKVVEDLVRGGKNFNSEVKDVSGKFIAVRDTITSQDGYDLRKEQEEERKEVEGRMMKRKSPALSTQKIFELKTKMRCEYVAEQAIQRCRTWFDEKYDACLRTIFIPLISHLLCLPMRFKFLCYLTRLMTKWCKNRIPVAGNFGQTYDNVNKTVVNLTQSFTTEVSVQKKEQSTIVGVNITKAKLSDDIQDAIEIRKSRFNSILAVIQVLASCSFIFLFCSAFSYANNYNADIRHDNIYITTYFRQIDARRKKQKKRTLLPLRNGETSNFIFPLSPKVQGPEVMSTVLSLIHTLPLAILLSILCGTDYILYKLFKLIHKHSFIQYEFTSRHHLEIHVGGTGLLAKLLRGTIGALNTSSEMTVESNNLHCLPKPHAMSSKDYLHSSLPMVCLLLLTFLQVYICRLRRVVTSFYFPKREKRRVLFLYNETMRKRISYIKFQRKRIMRRARISKLLARGMVGNLYHYCPFLRRFLRRRCMVCDRVQSKTSWMCKTPSCGAVYCASCWSDMKQFCFACTPYDGFISADSDSEHDTRYAN